jgi:hypothetical protein
MQVRPLSGELIRELKNVEGQGPYCRVLWLHLHENAVEKRSYGLLWNNELHKLPKEDLLDVRGKLEDLLKSYPEGQIFTMTGLNGQLSGSMTHLIGQINEAVESIEKKAAQRIDEKDRSYWV